MFWLSVFTCVVDSFFFIYLQILDVLSFLFIMNIEVKYAFDSYNILNANKYTLILLMYFIVLW